MSTSKTVKPIGGDFPISIDLLNQPSRNMTLPKNRVNVASGRDAIRIILDNLDSRSIVLLPSYLCDSMLRPFEEMSRAYAFYGVLSDLTINLSDVERCITEYEPTALVLIQYFGFIHLNTHEISELCRANGVSLIEGPCSSLAYRCSCPWGLCF